jgi:hypothetical protein
MYDANVSLLRPFESTLTAFLKGIELLLLRTKKRFATLRQLVY